MNENHLEKQTKPERGLKHPVELQCQQHPCLLSQNGCQSRLPFQSECSPQDEPQPQLNQEAKPVWTNHQKLLLMFLSFSFCATILGIVYYTQKNHGIKQAHTVTPCYSPACQVASARLSMSVDPFTQPCDYFLYTCGADRLSPATGGRQRDEGIFEQAQSHRHSERKSRDREKRHIISHRPMREDKVLDRKTALLQYLRDILESNTESGSAVEKAKGFYRSCLDTRSIEIAGAEPFLTLVQKLGGWAVSGQWDQTDFNSTLSLLMKEYHTFPFFNLYVGKDQNEIARGITRKYIQIDQPDLLIPIEWNSKTLKSQAKTQTLLPFLASCERYLALLGAPADTSLLHVGLFISLSSELAVATAPLSYRLQKGQLYQRMTIKELQSQAPAIDWLGCLQTAFHPHPISPEDHVLLHNFPYIVQMSRVISKWLNKHELRTRGPLHTFMGLNLLHTLIPALDSRFANIERNLSVALGHTEEEVPRWKHCVSETEKGFDNILTYLLNEKIAQREAEEIIMNIFSSFKSKLVGLKWRDEKSRQLVLNKVQSLTPKLWTKSKIPSEAELNQRFSEVTVNTDGYFSNYIQLLSLQQRRRYKLFSFTEEIDILSVKPFLLGNDLLFPMGMFIPPLFHPTYPRAMNYGVLGALMAKAVFHLLLPEIHSLSKSVEAVGECVWTQYLTVTQQTERGEAHALSAEQLQETWVQYSALQVALQAYHQSLKTHPDETSLAGVSHTHLFLTSFSQVNCEADPYRQFMPFESSFLITVICASQTCPTLKCSSKPQQPVQTC